MLLSSASPEIEKVTKLNKLEVVNNIFVIPEIEHNSLNTDIFNVTCPNK